MLSVKPDSILCVAPPSVGVQEYYSCTSLPKRRQLQNEHRFLNSVVKDTCRCSHKVRLSGFRGTRTLSIAEGPSPSQRTKVTASFCALAILCAHRCFLDGNSHTFFISQSSGWCSRMFVPLFVVPAKVHFQPIMNVLASCPAETFSRDESVVTVPTSVSQLTYRRPCCFISAPVAVDDDCRTFSCPWSRGYKSTGTLMSLAVGLRRSFSEGAFLGQVPVHLFCVVRSPFVLALFLSRQTSRELCAVGLATQKKRFRLDLSVPLSLNLLVLSFSSPCLP